MGAAVLPAERGIMKVDRGGKCTQIRANGQRCEANPMRGSAFCFFHSPGEAEKRAAARKAGGVARSGSMAVLPPCTPDETLKTASDVVRLFGVTINHVLRGELDHKVGTVVGYLSGLLLKAFGQAELESRVAALEAIVKRQPLRLEGIPDSYANDEKFSFQNPAKKSEDK